jgi:mono/diheme cytochrome c family protein
MHTQAIRILLPALMSVLALAARADETALKLADGPELAIVRANCSVCHSLDYVQMNAPFLKKAGWEAEVRKMVKVMGAPVSDDDAAKILAYLTRSYGVE